MKNPNARRKEKPSMDDIGMVDFASNTGIDSKDVKDNDTDMFSDELGQNNNEHLKELFEIEKNLEAKTDLSGDQINHICKLYYRASLTGDTDLKYIITQFMRLRISRDRKGRKEYVQATVGTVSTERRGLFDGIKNMFGGGQR